MTTKDTLINVGLLAGGIVATLAAAGVYGKGSRATGAATYLVVSTTERDFDTDAPLYWSNKHGWTTKRSATRFSEDEKARLRLPMGGAWEPVGKGSRAKRSAQDVYRHRRMAALDPSEFPAIPGMQGPFRYEGGDILYYDPREGKYYDRRRDLYVQHPGKGSMIRDGSYEATLMFDADEDDTSLRAQRALDDNPYVPQATPLTRQAQRTITSAQGSAARGSRMAGVSASVERDSLSGLWSVLLHDGRRIVNVTGDVFTTKVAAEREAKAMLAQARAGVAIDTLGAMFWEKHHKPFLMTSAQGSAGRQGKLRFRRA